MKPFELYTALRDYSVRDICSTAVATVGQTHMYATDSVIDPYWEAGTSIPPEVVENYRRGNEPLIRNLLNPLKGLPEVLGSTADASLRTYLSLGRSEAETGYEVLSLLSGFAESKGLESSDFIPSNHSHFDAA